MCCPGAGADEYFGARGDRDHSILSDLAILESTPHRRSDFDENVPFANQNQFRAGRTANINKEKSNLISMLSNIGAGDHSFSLNTGSIGKPSAVPR